MILVWLRRHVTAAMLIFTMIVVTGIYWPGLSGSWLFDDYPNIVDNHGVQPSEASIPSLVRAALSSPSSEFKRPLASLSFAANYLATGLNPYWMKLTNLVIHLLNGLLAFALARVLLRSVRVEAQDRHTGIVAALIAASWMLLPINLTAVLYIVQRMESMANLFVLLGLLGYVAGRRRMLTATFITPSPTGKSVLGWGRFSLNTHGFSLCLLSITLPTAMGLLAKETAVMLPLYALLIEWILFGFRRPAMSTLPISAARCDRRIVVLFVLVLVLPMVMGLSWLLPGVLDPEAWATRDFTLATRLLSEARIIIDYIVWTLLPTSGALSFYHDDFSISGGLLAPWTTLAGILFVGALIALMLRLRQRQPLVALGIALFLGCQLLTGTILPLELIYEHRNYFASFGLLLAIVPLLAAPAHRSSTQTHPGVTSADSAVSDGVRMALPRYVLLAGLMLYWTSLTAVTAYAWGNPLRLAENLAERAPQSPRAQYELGRNYIINSHYDPSSPFTRLAYAPLERAAALPNSSILPEQALIFMNSRMHLPLEDAWWNSMISKLRTHIPGVQDESSLAALTQCNLERHCDLPKDRMVDAFQAALAHPNPSARLLATYSEYAWSVLDDHNLGERMIERAIKRAPNEPAYQITLIHMLTAQDRTTDARAALNRLQTLNIGGSLTQVLVELRNSLGPK